jgi:hypothetical protein
LADVQGLIGGARNSVLGVRFSGFGFRGSAIGSRWARVRASVSASFPIADCRLPKQEAGRVKGAGVQF